MGRASSVAAAKAVSSRARFRMFWAIRVVGRSPVGWIDGNSSASMPLTCDWNGPALTWSVSFGPVSRSIRWPPGSEPTRSASSRAGTVVDPSVSTLPGTQYTSPISRFVVVRRRPPSSVLRRTFASTGSVLLLETARLTTPRPRARFSCMTESFTSGPLHGRGQSRGSRSKGCVAQGSRALAKPRQSYVYLPSFFYVRHHHHHGVDSVDGHARRRSAAPWTMPSQLCPSRTALGTRRRSRGGEPGQAADGHREIARVIHESAAGCPRLRPRPGMDR